MRPVPKRKPQKSIHWTKVNTKEVIDLWNGSVLSVQQIADKMGTTRGSIVGKIFRLRQEGVQLKNRIVGLRPDGTAAKPRTRQPRPPAPSKHYPPLKRGGSVGGVVSPPNLNTPTPDTYVDIVALERHHCREVMVMKPTAMYCGANKQEKSSFCPFHHAKNWQLPYSRVR